MCFIVLNTFIFQWCANFGKDLHLKLDGLQWTYTKTPTTTTTTTITTTATTTNTKTTATTANINNNNINSKNDYHQHIDNKITVTITIIIITAKTLTTTLINEAINNTYKISMLFCIQIMKRLIIRNKDSTIVEAFEFAFKFIFLKWNIFLC